MDSISEQKKYLSENLVVESLRMYESNQKDIKEFSQAKGGSVIAEYLNNKAWNEDSNGDTRVFLVRDKKTRKIAFFYALNCGILYKDLNDMEMTLVEREIVEKFVKAKRQSHDKGLSDAARDSANKLLSSAYEMFDEKIKDPDRAYKLLSYAEDKACIKEEREEDANQIGDSEFVKNVQEIYPAIDIKFLCKDANYKPGIELDFKFGIYVFWEIIVPHILKISELVGCKYVYLFAADNSEQEKSDEQINSPVLYSKDYDMDREEDIANQGNEFEKNVKKLVQYYCINLKFRPVSDVLDGYRILKPHFERNCYTLVQDVADLQDKRESYWARHDSRPDAI